MPIKILLVSDDNNLEKVRNDAMKHFASRRYYPVIDAIASSNPSKIMEYLDSKKMARPVDYVAVNCENRAVGSEIAVEIVDKFPEKIVFMIVGKILPVLTRQSLKLATELDYFIDEVVRR